MEKIPSFFRNLCAFFFCYDPNNIVGYDKKKFDDVIDTGFCSFGCIQVAAEHADEH